MAFKRSFLNNKTLFFLYKNFIFYDLSLEICGLKLLYLDKK